jgi:hypothetical protein
MLRQLIRALALLTVAGIAWLVYAFGLLSGWWQPLRRPRTVSPAARYVSLESEETWFDCQLDQKKQVDTCRAWDINGKVIVAGDFRLDEEGRAATETELKPSKVLFYNGQVYRICLFSPSGICGRFLVSVAEGQ